MKKMNEMNEYLDWYESLLTEKQADICSQYYREDLSLSEISENYDISRAAVQDTLKRSEKLLFHYEEKLQLIAKFHARNEIYGKIKELNISAVNQLVQELEEID